LIRLGYYTQVVENMQLLGYRIGSGFSILKATVDHVLSFDNLTPTHVSELLHQYGKDDGIGGKDIPEFYERFKDKKYCLLIYIKDVRKVSPFEINKKGYGAMARWICVGDIKNICK